MDNNNEQRAILVGGCITLIVAMAILALCVITVILDKLC